MKSPASPPALVIDERMERNPRSPEVVQQYTVCTRWLGVRGRGSLTREGCNVNGPHSDTSDANTDAYTDTHTDTHTQRHETLPHYLPFFPLIMPVCYYFIFWW